MGLYIAFFSSAAVLLASIVVAIVLEQAIDSENADNAALKARNVLQTALQIKGVL